MSLGSDGSNLHYSYSDVWQGGLMRRGMYGLGALFLLAVGVGGFTRSHLQAVQAGQYATEAEVLLKIQPLGNMVEALAAVGRRSEEKALPTSRTLTVATGRNNQRDSIPTGQGSVHSLIELQNGELISGGSDGTLRRWRDGQAVGAAITNGQSSVVSDETLGSKHKFITNASGKIAGINNLRIGDKQYNVKFDSGSFDNLYMDWNLNPPFKRWPFPPFDESGELTKAMNIINATLNSLDRIPQSVGDDLQPRSNMPPAIGKAPALVMNHIYCIPLHFIITERTYKVKSDPVASVRSLCSSYNFPKPLAWDVNLFSEIGTGVFVVYAQISLIE
jgi:hypothetical protein